MNEDVKLKMRQVRLRGDNVLAGLTGEQQLQLYEWLELLPMPEVLKQVAKEPPKGFGVRLHLTSLRRFYAKAQAAFSREVLGKRGVTPSKLDRDLGGAVRQSGLQLATVQAPTPQSFGVLSRWLIRLQEVDQRERTQKVREEELKLERERAQANGQRVLLEKRRVELAAERMALERERFEFNAARAALLHLDRLREIGVDDSLDDEAKILAARRAVFGRVPEDLIAIESESRTGRNEASNGCKEGNEFESDGRRMAFREFESESRTTWNVASLASTGVEGEGI